MLFIEATANQSKAGPHEIRHGKPQQITPDLHGKNQSKNRAFRSESVLSVPMKRRSSAKLLHESV